MKNIIITPNQIELIRLYSQIFKEDLDIKAIYQQLDIFLENKEDIVKLEVEQIPL